MDQLQKELTALVNAKLPVASSKIKSLKDIVIKITTTSQDTDITVQIADALKSSLVDLSPNLKLTIVYGIDAISRAISKIPNPSKNILDLKSNLQSMVISVLPSIIDSTATSDIPKIEKTLNLWVKAGNLFDQNKIINLINSIPKFKNVPLRNNVINTISSSNSTISSNMDSISSNSPTNNLNSSLDPNELNSVLTNHKKRHRSDDNNDDDDDDDDIIDNSNDNRNLLNSKDSYLNPNLINAIHESINEQNNIDNNNQDPNLNEPNASTRLEELISKTAVNSLLSNDNGSIFIASAVPFGKDIIDERKQLIENEINLVKDQIKNNATQQQQQHQQQVTSQPPQQLEYQEQQQVIPSYSHNVNTGNPNSNLVRDNSEANLSQVSNSMNYQQQQQQQQQQPAYVQSFGKEGDCIAPQVDPTVPPDQMRILTRTVYFGGITSEITKEDLLELVEEIARVDTITVNYPKCNAFVKLLTRKEAELIKERFQKYDFKNATFKVGWGCGYGPKDRFDYHTGSSLFVLNQMTENELRVIKSSVRGGGDVGPSFVVEEPDFGTPLKGEVIRGKYLDGSLIAAPGFYEAWKQKESGGWRNQNRNFRSNNMNTNSMNNNNMNNYPGQHLQNQNNFQQRNNRFNNNQQSQQQQQQNYQSFNNNQQQQQQQQQNLSGPSIHPSRQQYQGNQNQNSRQQNNLYQQNSNQYQQQTQPPQQQQRNQYYGNMNNNNPNLMASRNPNNNFNNRSRGNYAVVLGGNNNNNNNNNKSNNDDNDNRSTIKRRRKILD